MRPKTWHILVIVVLLMVGGCQQHDRAGAPARPCLTAKACLEEAEAALAADSIRQGETLMRKAIDLAEASEDWHNCYIAYQRLAEALSQANPEEALRLMKMALAVYEQHPDDERNHVILLDYAGTYAAQAAYVVGHASKRDSSVSVVGHASKRDSSVSAVGHASKRDKGDSYAEALDFVHRAYDIAEKSQMTDLECQTLTSLANIAWAKEDYRQSIVHARQAEALATDDLLQGALQVLARSYLDLHMLDSAETVYRQMEPGDNVHLAYIVQSNLAKIALRRMGATRVEDDVDDAFGQMEDFYFQALEQKDAYYQETLRQEMENQQLAYRSQVYRRTLLVVVVASALLLLVVVLALRYRLRMLRQQRAYEQSRLQNELRVQEQEKRRLQQEAAHQKALLHQANEVVAFLQNFILERTEVMKKLQNQSGDALICLSPHEWSEMERTLNAIDDNRFATIREQHPGMTEDDIRLCILTRLGLSNRTIGNIYCITISAVQHRKLKLKKEVFGETDPDVTLEQILKS